MESRSAATLYFTGNHTHNIKMRKLAKSLGMKLNRYGLFKDNKMLDFDSEKDIFDHLNMEYVIPSKRN